MRSFALACGLSLFVLFGSKAAQAQDVAAQDGHIEYHFGDDALAAESRGPWLDWFRDHLGRPRVMLIRPRVQFVPELLKSTEAL